jgi:hypothetical protein
VLEVHQKPNSLGETSAVRSEHLETVEHAIICDLTARRGRKQHLNQKFYLSGVSTKRIIGRTTKNASRNTFRHARNFSDQEGGCLLQRS